VETPSNSISIHKVKVNMVPVNNLGITQQMYIREQTYSSTHSCPWHQMALTVRCTRLLLDLAVHDPASICREVE
jgi:hypothetical protein